jgi:uncharacterized membrane protein
MERKKLQSAGSNYTHLRGLFAVPGGALLILAALGNWEWGPLRQDWVFLVALLAVMTASLGIARYYNEQYGRITISTEQRARAAIAAVGTTALMLAVSFLLRSDADWSLDLPVNGLAAALAVGFLSYYAVTVGVKPHHAIIWGPLLVGALLPVWGGLDLTDTSNLGLVLAGVAAIASGIFDHRFLVRSLEPAHDLTPTAGDVRA